ncbi:MAG: nitrous oxide reductase family maturation protein NosD [Candidatus Odinarchaeota archaeon]
MKSNTNNRFTFFIVLGIIFALILISNNINFNGRNREINSGKNDNNDLDTINLKISKISEKIHIINNSGWVDFRNAGNCTGQGIYSDPYVIKNLEIDGGGSGSCIVIQNSDVYFKIENCTIYNSGDHPNAGIKITDVENAQLVANNCSSTYYGIYLWRSNDNTVSGNTVNNNHGGIQLYLSSRNDILGDIANNNDYGMYLIYSFGNNLIGNTAHNNTYGIYLDNCQDNDLLENTANHNQYGIFLRRSSYNTVSRNILLENDECIIQENCHGNEFSENYCTFYVGGGEIPFETIIPILSISGGIVILVALLLLNRRKKKRL